MGKRFVDRMDAFINGETCTVKLCGFIWHAVSKEDVLSMNMTPAMRWLDELRQDEAGNKGKAYITFSGYISDVRDISEIPEIRKFVGKLFDKAPDLFWYLSADSAVSIMKCLYEISEILPGSTPFTKRFAIDLIGNPNNYGMHARIDASKKGVGNGDRPTKEDLADIVGDLRNVLGDPENEDSMGKRLVDRASAEGQQGNTMKEFEFSCVPASSGEEYRYRSTQVFDCDEDERVYRDMVERVFRGATVPVPGSDLVLSGQREGSRFSFNLSLRHRSQIFGLVEDNPFGMTYLQIYGTAEERDQSPVIKAKPMIKAWNNAWKMRHDGGARWSVDDSEDWNFTPEKPYAVCFNNALLALCAGIEWVMDGMTEKCCKYLTCVAIDMLKEAT